jgi:AcrR family transcriptional regulator
MDDVAAEAGVAKGTLYGYFRHKDDLFFHTCTEGFAELCESIERMADCGGDFAWQLLGACERISQFFVRRGKLVRVMQAEESRSECRREGADERWLELRRRLVTAVSGILQRGARAGHIRPDVPPEILANILLGMLRTRNRRLAHVPPEMRRHELIVDLFCNGAARRAEPKE